MDSFTSALQTRLVLNHVGIVIPYMSRCQTKGGQLTGVLAFDHWTVLDTSKGPMDRAEGRLKYEKVNGLTAH